MTARASLALTVLLSLVVCAGCAQSPRAAGLLSSGSATASAVRDPLVLGLKEGERERAERVQELLDSALPRRDRDVALVPAARDEQVPVDLAWAGQGVPAGTRPSESGPPQTNWSLQSAVGFTLDPSGFLGSMSLDYDVAREFRVGPLVQVGADDDHTIVAPTVNIQYVLDLSVFDPSLRPLRPYAQGGLGFAWIDKKHRDDDVGFLIDMGFGLEWEMTERLALGSGVLFNVLPAKTAGDRFFFSWQLAAFRFRF